jgi:hypothetical protein
LANEKIYPIHQTLLAAGIYRIIAAAHAPAAGSAY